MDIMKILNNDLEGMSEEEKQYVNVFSEKLKDKIIEDLVEVEENRIISLIKENKEGYKDLIYSIYAEGIIGYRSMNIQLLINIYIDKCGDEKLITTINDIIL
ncbi:hypothetical protein [Clostridium paraputrificum]|uniref:Uncharacterized protein n=1 Tax=Clostridium paraputrificum TaxID=29363 RepID=A0A6N3FXT5_9CLOT|nr:hypothetical protein [Clostridium sp.]MBS5987276.1 hypothetical protein [Clostridium sp.]